MRLRKSRALRTAPILLVVTALVVFRPDRALRVASGVTAHLLCSAIFVSGLDPDKTFAEAVRPMTSVAGPFLRHQVDRNEKAVRASVLGVFASTSIFHAGYGCRLEYEDSRPVPPPLPEATATVEPAIVEPAQPELRAALDRAFVEEDGQPPRNLKAVVIVKDGRIVAERYARGYGPETPLPAFSVSKSVINALIGILVRQGKLDVDAPAAVPAWRAAGDPRAAITPEHLMRMTSGLAMREDGSGFDPASQMVYTQDDMAAYAAAGRLERQPGTRWAYTSVDTLVLCALIRDAVGGGQAEVLRFAQGELFAPLGMRRVTMEFDGAGTPEGTASLLAPARDWARFGLLFLNDGVAPDGRRILPEGWVARCRTSTLGTTYGAGFWTNDGPSESAASRIALGMPPDAFFASGNRGQRIYIVPSERMLLVRLGMTHRPPNFDIVGDMRLLRAAIVALREEGQLPTGLAL